MIENDFFWFMPCYGDSRRLGANKGFRNPSIQYLTTLATVLDQTRFSGALFPAGFGSPDPIVLASAIVQNTKRFRPLIAIRPGSTTPQLAARMTASLDEISAGRVDVNVVPGDQLAVQADGIKADTREARYDLAEDWIKQYRELLHGERAASAATELYNGREPRLFYAGSSERSKDIASKHADVYLTWGELPESVAEKIESIRSRTDRAIRFGLRIHVVLRETDEEAKVAANRLIADITKEDILRAQAKIRASDSVGRKRMQELHQGDRERIWLRDGLWAGIGLVRGGAGTALVGSPTTIKSLIREYQDCGVSVFIMSGYPHLEEALNVSDYLLPELESQAAEQHNTQECLKF